MKNEKTSKRVASDAARILKAKPGYMGQARKDGSVCRVLSPALWDACLRVAASSLTQSPDKKPGK